MPAHTVEASETTEPETPKMPATVIRPIDPAGNIKAGSKAETELSYREPIIVEPATNFRQFAQRSFGGLSAAETATATKEPENEFKPVKAKIEESPLPVQEQSADVWQDRWGQIKKNNNPGSFFIGRADNREQYRSGY